MTPFIPWTPAERDRQFARIRAMPCAELEGLASSVSEGLEDLPEDMRAHYWEMRAEQRRRAGLELPPGS